jgi:hypothetical protein
MVCDKLPFTAGKSHEAIEGTVAGVTVVTVVSYDFAQWNGQACRAHGRGNRQYEAIYAGTFCGVSSSRCVSSSHATESSRKAVTKSQ